MMIETIVQSPRLPAGGFTSALIAPLACGGAMRSIGPFVTVAHALPAVLAPGALAAGDDVRPHPHIGIATLSYLFDGAVTHRDSLGNVQEITPGAVAWMVAGRGVVHSERYERLRRDGGTMQGLQIWIALTDEDAAPSFQHYPAGGIPAFTGEGVTGHLLAGSAAGLHAPVEVPSPLFLQDVHLAALATHPVPDGFAERAAHVFAGAVECGGSRVDAGHTVVFAPGSAAAITALEPAHLLCFGGEAIGPRNMWWNFVSASRDRIEAAKADWRAGRMALPTADADDFTPAPEDRQRPLFELNPAAA